jgi:hypothetical protein
MVLVIACIRITETVVDGLTYFAFSIVTIATNAFVVLSDIMYIYSDNQVLFNSYLIYTVILIGLF